VTSSLRREGDGGRTAPGSPPGAPRSRDTRCPSGSGWGEALVAGALSGVPSGSRVYHLARAKRQTGGAGRRKPAGPWPVRPRLAKHDVPDGASASDGGTFCLLGPQGSSGGRRVRRAAPPGSGVRHGGWLQPHPEVFLQVRRKPGASSRRAWNGDRSILWLCSWIVLVAEVGERHLVQVSSSRRPRGWPARKALGLAYRPRASCTCSAGERVSEAGSRWQSREHGGGLSMILRLRVVAKAAVRRRARARESGSASGSRSCRGESTRRGKASWRR